MQWQIVILVGRLQAGFYSVIISHGQVQLQSQAWVCPFHRPTSVTCKMISNTVPHFVKVIVFIPFQKTRSLLSPT